MDKSYLVYGIFFLSLLAVFVFAQTPLPNSLIVVGASSCSETDGGLNYLQAGSVTGSFWWLVGNSTNSTQTFNGTFSDTCVSSTTLVEVACGSSVNPAYSGLAGAVYIDCSNPNPSYGCVNGACVLVGNSTNSTNGPDLTTFISINNILNLSSNSSTQYLVNYTVNFTNIGNVASTPVTGFIGSSMACSSGTGGGSGGPYPVPALNPSQTTSVQRSNWVFCNGLFNAYSIVDLYNNLTELNENNNNATLSVII